MLGFVARFGIVPRTAVATWAETARTVTLTRERRLREAGLVEVWSGVAGGSKLVTCTREGLRVSGFVNLRPARFSLGSVVHESQVAELAASLERSGFRTLSEREILAEEREEGESVYSALLPGGRRHRADLIRKSGDRTEAIEVELAAKGSVRLDELLRAWRRAVAEGRLSRVVYRCAPKIGRVVGRAVERTRSASAITVEEL